MKRLYLLLLLLPLLTITAACGDDNPLDNPPDMATQNMMIESRDKTLLGQTDIYITDNLNFKSTDYYFADMGQVLDLGHIEEQESDLTTITGEVAISEYEGYMAIKRSNLHRFPSNKLGIFIGSSYYRIWIDSWLKDNKQKVGALVNYALYLPKKFELPTPFGMAGLINASQGERTLTVDVPQKDCEFDLCPEASRFATISVTTNQKRLSQATITLSQAIEPVPGRYELYIRFHNSYTTLYFEVK